MKKLGVELVIILIALVAMVGCSKDKKPEVVHCQGVWSPCKGDCGAGKGKQQFVVLQAAQNGGQACEAQAGQEKSCTASVCALPDLCKSEGKAIKCEAQLGYQHKLGCVVDGDYKPVYFTDVNEAEAWANAKPEYLKIKMKDGSTKNVGPFAFGWHCDEL